jgi:cyanoexosortase A
MGGGTTGHLLSLSRMGSPRQRRRLRRLLLSRRALWIGLACLLAFHHLLFSFLTQGAGEAVNALLIWGGALVILADQPPGWRPRPAPIGLAAGAVLIAAVLWRSQQITSLDGASRLLPLLAGLALVLLAAPLRRLASYGPLLLILALPLLMRGLLALISTEKLSLLTARISQALLMLCNLPAEVQGNVLRLPEGAVQIMGPCSGIGMVMQLIMVGVIFALAFPMRHRWQNGVMLLVAPLLAVIANGFRIALLAGITASAIPSKDWWFEFFHESEGSLVFSGIAVLVFIWLYDLWMERQITRLEQTP